MDLLSKKYVQAEEINKLKEENAVLQAYKDVNEDFKKAWEELKAENERLKEENKLIRQLHKDLSDKLFEFQKIEDALQEIKTIAEKIIIAYTGIAKSNEKLKAFDLRNRLQQILQKITKAEEE